MNDPKKLSINNYNYYLPEDRIAKYPLPQRDASKLLIYQYGKISQDIYRNLPDLLPTDSLLIFNDTKVIEARLFFQKPTGGIIELFCLEPDHAYDITTAMEQRKEVRWLCLIGGASKWKHGQLLEKRIQSTDNEIILQAEYVEKLADCFVIRFSWNTDQLTFAEILRLIGAVPLPPYIKREATAVDAERYQTVYAHEKGSVAAPTAGLHFTENILEELASKKIRTDFVTLHVGAGTFKPVKSETLEHHEMHAEFIRVSRRTIENIVSNLSRKVIPVGTTSLRTIETLYWLGVKIAKQFIQDNKDEMFIDQWESYDLRKWDISASKALKCLVDFMDEWNMDQLVARTQILIARPYQTRVASGIITNFHQPKSTLLLLVAALIGDDWKKVYDYALRNDFRFLSYGDGCLLWFDSTVAATS